MFYEAQINSFCKNADEVKRLLRRKLKEIKYLENIYMGDGEFYGSFSKEFENNAFKERQEKCLLSSACYSILRNKYFTTL